MLGADEPAGGEPDDELAPVRLPLASRVVLGGAKIDFAPTEFDADDDRVIGTASSTGTTSVTIELDTSKMGAATRKMLFGTDPLAGLSMKKPPVDGDMYIDTITGKTMVYTGGTWVEVGAPDPDPPVPSVPMDVVDALVEDRAGVMYSEFLAAHRVATCIEPDCGVCRELAQIKYDTIQSVKDQLVEKIYDAVVEKAAMYPDSAVADSLLRKVKERMAEITRMDARELW